MARRDTRELILTTSLELFNEYGEPNVTTNQIADEADISPGNLYYHFRSKDDIVLELFKRFLVRFQPLIEVSGESLLQAEDLWFQLHLSFELKGQFRFLYRNLMDLTARIPNLDHAMRGLLQRERKSALNSLAGLEQAGVAVFDDWQRELLADSILLSLTYWIPFVELFEPDGAEDGSAQTRAIARVLLIVTPHFREPERSQFTTLARRYLTEVE
ncbi:MAG: TetR/AcrR family transcriptional regulator [Xanthomonadales bacterium]|nr:TetR/AcrR family transcriptional regulator [Gammaproteobacteria bacterium]MBT8054716.1 TetR/AcrR family transcriptional regulator [Gammaproteobacteria bacterium]NND57790.1 TetR/AcrR family transcriptional regulator [Xanthomonadales bacterium]NNK51439.1 TetR/AcrR family transcriptional regulator [Xanthomonadales bacterium]